VQRMHIRFRSMPTTHAPPQHVCFLGSGASGCVLGWIWCPHTLDGWTKLLVWLGHPSTRSSDRRRASRDAVIRFSSAVRVIPTWETEFVHLIS
jgi:hypothetical protein